MPNPNESAPTGRDNGSPDGTIVPATEFDRFSSMYRQTLDKSTWLAGEGGEYFAELKARYLARILGHDFGGKVLYFGCGIGLLSRCLLDILPGCHLHGYDPSRSSLGMIPGEVTKRGRFTFFKEELECDYDLIVVANVMHHVPPARRLDVILDLQKRLSTGGKLAAFEHNPLNPLTRLAVKQCLFDVGVVLVWPRELLGYFRSAGLVPRRRDYITFFPRWLASLRPLEPKLSWCLLGAQYAVIGEKACGVAAKMDRWMAANLE